MAEMEMERWVFERGTMRVALPWLETVPDITQEEQLRVLLAALSALAWEWAADDWCQMAAQALTMALAGALHVSEVVECLAYAYRDLLLAAERWQDAGVSFAEQAVAQSQRMLLMAERVQRWAVQATAQWGLPAPDLVAISAQLASQEAR